MCKDPREQLSEIALRNQAKCPGKAKCKAKGTSTCAICSLGRK